ncbi:putative T7SS-secreted protein [Streptomyces odontomachi]|uniref:putative T7SS-secreted protein n=1 Tax=Streptomyces odontomachi TaxID=2944940 RepID=UPI00210950DA|nr:DUF6531 domain-containing protein [Streptomyces sp. ODS25]
MSVFGEIGGHIAHGVNKGLGAVEHGVDVVKKGVGEGVDWTTDEIGAGLDRVGAHGLADTVEDIGDELASDLGATPGEKQLGETDDPNELIHGYPKNLRIVAGHLKDFHKAFDRVGQGMRGLDSSHWRGEAADTFREKFAMHPTKWLHAADACEAAGKALDSYADTVAWALTQAAEAIATYAKGKGASDLAHENFRKECDAYRKKMEREKDPGPGPAPFTDPGQAEIRRAREILATARRQRNKAGQDAADAVRSALKHAPAEPPPLSRLGADFADAGVGTGIELAHFTGGVVKGTAGLVNLVRGINPLDTYNATHPAEYVQDLNLAAAGLVSTAAHPNQAVGMALDDFRKDPSEFAGRALPNLFTGDGAGAVARGGAEAGVRAAAEAGARAGFEDAAKAGARGAVRRDAAAVSRDEGVVSHGTDPIDLATGRMYLPQTDVELPGALPLAFRRRVESGYRLGHWFGPSWSSTVDQRLEIDAEGVVFVQEDGLLLAYPHPQPGTPVLPGHGPRWPLERAPDDAGYVIRDPETGRAWHFADEGEGLANPGESAGSQGVRRAVLEQIDDRNGHWISFSYAPESGAPTAITHSAGYRLGVVTTADRITALHLAGAAPDGTDQVLVRYGYDADGNLTEVVNSSGKPLRFTYDTARRVTSWTDTNARSYTYEYDDEDRCVAEAGSAGHMSLRLTYGTDPESGLRVTRTTTADGHTRHFLINTASQVIAESDPLGAVTRYQRDRANRLLSQTDPLGHTTELRYDAAGRLTAVVRPDGRETRAEYEPLPGSGPESGADLPSGSDVGTGWRPDGGLPVRVTGPDGLTWHQSYDTRGNRTSVTDPTGATTTYAYDEAGHLASVTDAAGHRTLVRCDRAGLPLEVVDPLGAVTRYERDAFGRPVTLTDPLGGTTRLEWTVEGHLSRRTAPDGTVESWTYDGEGNCTTHTDPQGAVTRFEYGHFDVLTARTDPDGVRYTFDHDTELRLTRVTNPQGLTWDYAYDPAGHLISETDFDGRILTYEYDPAGRLTSRTTPLGDRVTFDRNALGQVVRKTVTAEATGAGTSVSTYTYDLTDQLAEATAPGTSLTLLRDRYGRLRSETVDGRTIAYAYDELGRRTGRTTPSGAESVWTYDAVGRPASLTTSGRRLTFERDVAGREVGRRIGEAASLHNTFDPLGRLTTQSVYAGYGADGEQTAHRTYTYRADGHVTAIDDARTGVRRFDLDTAGRVTAVHAANWSERYAYDEAGNQTQATWPEKHPGHEARGPRTYAGTRITRAGDVHYEHDAAGRITLRRKTRLSRKPDVWHYEWDPEDRLTAVVTPDGTRWRYTYDPLGRRTAKQRMAADGETVTEETVFTWDATTLCEQVTRGEPHPNAITLTWDHAGLHPLTQTERITSGTPVVSAPDTPTSSLATLDGPSPATASEATTEEIASRFFAIITDLVGTPTELVDDQGTIAWHSRTTLWGTTTWNRSATTYTPLRFPGQYFDPESGLHYNYFRTYDPETARYLTPDPLGLTPAPNPVSYVDNPHVWADPEGLSPCPSEMDRRPRPPSYGQGNGNDWARSVSRQGRSDNSAVISGHGYYEFGVGDMQVPGGTWLKFYVKDGERLSDSIGHAIEVGENRLPADTYGPGKMLPDYIVDRPNGLRISGRSITVNAPTRLSEIVSEGMGAVHVVICREHIKPW